MRTIFLDTNTRLTQPCVATIGFFDGVHRGHQYLIRRTLQEADDRRIASMVITFDRDPLHTVAPEREPKHLSTLSLKQQWLAEMGIDTLVVLPFDETMAARSAADFMSTVLKKQLCVDTLVLGYDNRFGKPQDETFENYDEMGKKCGIDIVGCDAFENQSGGCSSTLIRRLVAEGKMAEAAELLSRPYTIEGIVVDGEKEGRKLGFPTANLQLEDSTLLLPPEGVYAVEVVLPQQGDRLQGMMNIGRRPTFGVHQLTVEIHIFDFNDSLYNQHIQVMIHQRIRSEKMFDSEHDLSRQLTEDKETVKAYFKTNKIR